MERIYKKCERCGHDGPHIETILTTGDKYGRVDCAECGRWVDWMSKPDQTKRPAAHRKMAKKFSRGFCEMCLIPQTELPNGESLQAHHVDEYQDGGEPTRENTWILCTACHSLVNWRRTYVDHLLKSLAERMRRWKDEQ